MKALAVLVCLLACVWRSEAHVYDACPAGWMSFGQSCYRYYGQSTNQITAENICRQFSGCSGGIGHLVSINDAAENRFVFSQVKSLTGITGIPRIWLGGRRRRFSQGFEWMLSDGTKLAVPGTYNNFPARELPQEQGRNCKTFSPEIPMEWQHVNCASPSLPFMCELQANVPGPANCPTANDPASGNPPSPLQAQAIRYNKAGNIEQRYTGRA